MRIPGLVASAAGAVAGVLAAAALFGSRAWDRDTARMAERVTTAGDIGDPRTDIFRLESLDGLPAPVVRYFEFALTPGQPLIRTARIEHEGEFRTAPETDWAPFRSVQHFSANPPGFVWDARIDMIPVAGVRVRDSYLNGRGSMLGKVAALIPVLDEAGSPELAAGALHRYLAESAWLPTALLPREELQWEPVDDSTARVALTDAGVVVALDVHFSPSGGIERVEAERYRDVDGTAVLTPFVGHFSEYDDADGMRIPTRGAVEWILPEGPLSYWRGRVTNIAYGF